MKPRRPFWGLFRRRECVLPTLRGWLLLGFSLLALTILAIKTVHPFLAVTDQIPGEALIVEGWEPDYALAEAIKEFQQHGYRKLYVVGGPLDRGAPLSEYKTYAELGAATLLRLGMKPEEVQAVPTPPVLKDRTYASGEELKNWLRGHGGAVTNFNVVCMGVHSRRSWLLIQKALGENFKVGIIAIESRDYEADHWWKSSEGVRTVTNEILAYGYARFFFRPPQD